MQSFQTNAESTAVWAEIAHDFNPLHLDPAFAATTPFGAPILHGSQTLTLAVARLMASRPGARLEACQVRFLAPARVGAALQFAFTPEDAHAGILSVTDDHGTLILEGRASFTPSEGTAP